MRCFVAEMCRICSSKNTRKIFETKVLQYDISYFECDVCQYVQTEKPYWLDQAYRSAIGGADTGILDRNYTCAKRTTNICALLSIKDQPIIDYAGGYGLFVRLMRDIGFNTFWQDKYCQNLIAQGFESNKTIGRPALLTAFEVFEVFEHLDTPLADINAMFETCDNVLFSTLLIPQPTPQIEDWWYYAAEYGQHIGFFRHATLRYIADKHNKNFYSYGSSIHLFTDKKVSPFIFKIFMKFYAFIFFFSKRRTYSKTQDDFFTVKNSS